MGGVDFDMPDIGVDFDALADAAGDAAEALGAAGEFITNVGAKVADKMSSKIEAVVTTYGSEYARIMLEENANPGFAHASALAAAKATLGSAKASVKVATDAAAAELQKVVDEAVEEIAKAVGEASSAAVMEE